MNLERVRAENTLATPDALLEQITAQHLPRISQEQLQNLELGVREFKCPTPSCRLIGAEVKPDVVESEYRRLLLLLSSTAEQRAYARPQLLDCERLGEVVIGTDIKTFHTIVDRVAGSEHQDRQWGSGRPQTPADFDPVHPWHQDVEHHRVQVERLGQPKPLDAVAANDDLMPIETKDTLETVRHRWFIVNDKDPHALTVLRSKPAAEERDSDLPRNYAGFRPISGTGDSMCPKRRELRSTGPLVTDERNAMKRITALIALVGALVFASIALAGNGGGSVNAHLTKLDGKVATYVAKCNGNSSAKCAAKDAKLKAKLGAFEAKIQSKLSKHPGSSTLQSALTQISSLQAQL